jgi:hypothetical protein
MAIALAIASSGCAVRGECGHARETTYRCEPVAATITTRARTSGEVVANGCVGGPEAKDERVYPLGCQVDVPECSALDPQTPRTVECVIGADGTPEWYEPI